MTFSNANTVLDDSAFPVLVGDIGGTNARFAIVPDRGSSPCRLATQRTDEHADFEAAICASLQDSPLRPKTALLAAAGPLMDGQVDFTNSSWVLDPQSAMRATGIPTCLILNDFEAQALALVGLDPEHDFLPIGSDAAPQDDSKVVLGPGTGLGVAYLIRSQAGWVPVPGEGGHISLAPEDSEELELWAILLENRSRVSAETLLSGRGLTTLYRAVARLAGQSADRTDPAQIVDGADAGDPLCIQTLNYFCKFLGRVAGDFALAAVARGGVYLSGGISRKIRPYLLNSQFRTAFERKWPHEGLMQEIPTFLVDVDEPALSGLATLARQPDLFQINLAERTFRRCTN